MYKWHVEYQLCTDAYALRLINKNNDGTMDVATNITMEKRDAGTYVAPLMEVDSKDLQDLFNQLWSVGFRPKDGTGNAGHIEALKYHLEDMRKLVFKHESSN